MDNKELIEELIPDVRPLTSRFRKKYVETLALGILQYCYKKNMMVLKYMMRRISVTEIN